MSQFSGDPSFTEDYGPYENYAAGGYETSGQVYNSSVFIKAYDADSDSTVTKRRHSKTMVADKIT